MIPAQQGLKAADAIVAEVQKGLEHQPELLVEQRDLEPAFERPAILHRLGIREFHPVRIARRRPRRRALIGRGRELRTLRSWIAAARHGGPRVIRFHGSPGSGIGQFSTPW